MKRISIICLLLCGCLPNENITMNTTDIAPTPKTPLEEYKKCMGYSDKTIVHTTETPGRYIVIATEKSIEQPWANKQDYGQIYYTSLLECSNGQSIDQYLNQECPSFRNIGTQTKWQIGTFKTLSNSDLIFEKVVRAEFLPDGRFVDITDYCYIDRNNITTSYCGHFVHNSDWRKECKGKLMANTDNK